MAKKTSLLKQPQTTGKKAKTSQKVSMAHVHKIKENGKQKHLRAAETRKNYGGHLRRGRDWMAKHFAEPDQDTSEDTMRSGFTGAEPELPNTEDGIYNEPDFKHALDGAPTQYSDRALALLISYKCFYENLGLSTCDGIYSAFKRYWEEL
jgi:hypothetical protein